MGILFLVMGIVIIFSQIFYFKPKEQGHGLDTVGKKIQFYGSFILGSPFIGFGIFLLLKD